MPEDVYWVRCQLNDTILPSNSLTKEQARGFLAAAEHLANYLRTEYLSDDKPTGDK
jgi:hypothetical protein